MIINIHELKDGAIAVIYPADGQTWTKRCENYREVIDFLETEVFGL